MEKKGHYSHKKKIKQRDLNFKRGRCERETAGVFFKNFFLYFIFSHLSLRYTEIGQSEFVGARTKRLYSTRATRGNQKHRISPSFQLKF